MDKRLTVESDEWKKFTHLFKRKEIAGKTILLREGEVSKYAYLIEKGSLRTWFNNMETK
jgi:hypothetical protein